MYKLLILLSLFFLFSCKTSSQKNNPVMQDKRKKSSSAKVQVKKKKSSSVQDKLLKGIAMGLSKPQGSANPKLRLEIWEGHPGRSPKGEEFVKLMNTKQPTTVRYIESLNIDNIDKDDYIARVRAYLIPKKSGTYEFRFSKTDDGSNLFLSSDAHAKNKKSILFIDDWSEGEPVGPSEKVQLKAGKKYYIELILKENQGGNYVYVEWKEEGDLDYSKISGLVPYIKKRSK